ncbi:MAG: hypothetical protein Sapg2KO_31880 [Saprospiraceae bacterium]
MKTLLIKDETATGKVLHEISLKFQNEYITVRELIATRVSKEVEKYKDDIVNFTKGLVRPTDLEQRLNNKANSKIDLEKQIYVALDAFHKNGFFILVDDEQVEELDQQFLITDSTQVSFIKLTPLVGG